MKYCSYCEKEKINKDFNKDNSSKDKLCCICRHCQRIQHIERTLKNKILVMSHYSNGKPECACCGIKELEFLSIDHINGNGNKHRSSIKTRSGWTFYLWLKKNGFPSGYQVLCHNCNQAKGNFGNCPHKGETIYTKLNK